jgi:hypothetical protein
MWPWAAKLWACIKNPGMSAGVLRAASDASAFIDVVEQLRHVSPETTMQTRPRSDPG